MNAAQTPRTLRVALFGASGVAGAGVLKACLADPRVVEVVAVVRRSLGVQSPKLKEVLCADFRDLSPLAERLAGLDACMFCLGVSVTRVQDEAQYREITYDYPLAAGRALQKRSPGCTFHFLSGGGTDPTGHSRFTWARIKGDAETALAKLGLGGVVCWRPGYIHAEEPVPGRQLAEQVARFFYPLFRRSSRLSVPQLDLGRAMLQVTFEGRREGVLENRDIRAAAARYELPSP